MHKEVHRALVVRAMRVGCSVTAILSRRRSILRRAILAPPLRCCRGEFSTHCRLQLPFFSGACAGSFPPSSCGDTSPHTGFEIDTDPRCAKEEVLIGMTLIFCCSVVTTEEIRWLQSGVVVPRVTHPPLGRRRHLRQRARRERRSGDCYRDAPALLPARTSFRGPLWTSSVSGLLREKGKRYPLPPRPKYSTRACSSGHPRAPIFGASSSLKIERRCMRRVVHRVPSRGSGCPVHKKQLLPVLVVWAPRRKKRNEERHALNGNTSASAASSSCRSIPGSKRHSDGTFVVLLLRGAAAQDPPASHGA